MEQIIGARLPEVKMRDNTMRVEFIYTFFNKGQMVASYPFIGCIATNKNLFLEFAISELSETESGDLVKISSCVYYTGKKYWRRPTWYIKCKGKFWMDDLHEYKINNRIKELVEEDFIKDFWINNKIPSELILLENE